MTLVAWMMAGLLETGAAYAVFFCSPSRWWWAAGFHVASAAAWGLTLRWPRPEPRMWIVAGCQALAALILPGFGWFLAVAMARWFRLEGLGRIGAAYREYASYHAPLAARLETQSAIAMGIRRRTNIQSVTELLEEGNFRMKRKAIEHLAKRPTPFAVRMLRRALLDPHPDLQSFAAAALASVEHFVNDEIRKAELQVSHHPGSPSAHSYLGNKYFDYAYMGLLDSFSFKQYVDRAAASLDQSLALDPNQPGMLVRLGRMHLERRAWEAALKQFNRALKLEPELGAALLWRAEAHYRLRCWSLAIQDVEKAERLGAVPEALRETVTWLTAI